MNLACMSGIDILLVLGIMFLAGGGMFLLSLVPLVYFSKRLARSATRRGPLALYGIILAMTLFWGSVQFLAASAFFDARDKRSLVLGVCGAVGSLGLLVFLLAASKQSHAARAEAGAGGDAQDAPAPVPVPRRERRFQFWAQDLFVALVCYGAGLTLLSTVYGLDYSRAEEFLASAVYVFIAGTCGLFFATDLSRHAAWGQVAAKRALLFVGVFTLFPVTLPFSLVAWWRWRRTLTHQARAA